ncbi:MAG: ATP-binding protein [Nitrososphaerota archaeon]|nr:ATP-binding protein [Nitrososphaerota archaeon]
MPRGRLVILCGIPGSGKTTMGKLLVDGIKASIHIQTDAVRAMLGHATFDQSESQLVYDACYGIARSALQAGYLVVLDGTFMRDEYRLEARKRLRNYCARVDVVWIDCTLEAALERNSDRESPVPPEKLQAICAGFQNPKRAIRVDSSLLGPRAAAEQAARLLGLK